MRIFVLLFVISIFHVDGYSQSDISKQGFSFWNSKDFKCQFAMSYIAESNVEPEISVEESRKVDKALKFIHDGRKEQAVKVLEKYCTDESSPVFNFILGNLYLEFGNNHNAIVKYENAVKKYPNFLRAWKSLGLIYYYEQDYSKSLQAFHSVIKLGANDPEIYDFIGRIYMLSGSYVAAESAYQAAIPLSPENTDYKVNLLICNHKQGYFKRVISMSEELLKSNPENPDLWLLQADSYVAIEQPLKAIEVYELLNQLGYSSSEIKMKLVNMYIDQELYSLAFETLNSAIRDFPEETLHFAVSSADRLAKYGAFKESHAIYDYIISEYTSLLTEKDKHMLDRLSIRLAIAFGKDDCNVSILEDIVKADPLDGDALILLGKYYSRQCDYEKAAIYYEQASSIDEFRADAEFCHAQILVENGKYHEAVSLLKHVQLIKPRDSIQDYLGQIKRLAGIK